MSIATAEKILDFIFQKTPSGTKIEIGYFGGEPLLEFNNLKKITRLIKYHPKIADHPLELQVVTNGTIFSEEIAAFLNDMDISMAISCDGPPQVQDFNRKYPDGRTSSKKVERTILEALASVNVVMVNAVYTPQTFHYLPETVDYFYNLGVRNIFLNPDFSAHWTEKEANTLKEVFQKIGEKYLHWYTLEDPAIISFLDSKISLFLNNGCNNSDKCHMGTREFAFTPDGNIFPCERLVYDGERNEHLIGNIVDGVDNLKFKSSPFFSKCLEPECLQCSLRKYCMNWCGCTNFFSTGYYDKVGSLSCAYEKASISVAIDVFRQLSDKFGPSTITRLFKKQYLD